MNLPAGVVIETGKETTSIEPKKYVEKLIDEKFNGYLCVTIHGKQGLEEGVIVFNNGGIVSSNYDYYKFNKSFLGESALERSLNALNSKIGVIDLFSLTSYQVQLILTLNEENNLKEEVTKENLKVLNYFNEDYEKKLIEETGEGMEKVDLMKKFGLTRAVAKDSTRNQLMNKAIEENSEIEKTISKKVKQKEEKKTDEEETRERFSLLTKMLKKNKLK